MKRTLIALFGLLVIAVLTSCQLPNGKTLPDPTNTGWEHTGVVLTPWTGSTVLAVPNAVYDGFDFPDCAYIDALNVTIKRSKIHCDSPWQSALTTRANGFLGEDIEITSDNPGVSELRRAVILDGNFGTLRRIHTHGAVSGVFVGGNDILVEDSAIVDNYNVNGNSGDHASAIGATGGTHRVTIRNNNLATMENTNASSVISVYPESGAHTDWLIEGNLLMTSAEYCMYLGHTPPEQPNLRMRVIGNYFGPYLEPFCGRSGVLASWTNDPSNVWDENYRVTYDPDSGNYVKLGTEVPRP